MAHFEVIERQKEILRKALLTNQAVVDLLMNTGDNVADFEHFKTGSKSPAADRIKSHFFVPSTTTRDRNFITMRGRILRPDNNVIKETELVVYIICNEDQMDLLQGSRADLLADEVDRILNNGDAPLFGYGGISIGEAEEIRFVDGYSGWEIPYRTHETNRRTDLIDG